MIRLLLKRYQAMENDFMGDKIEIDDFVYKKDRASVYAKVIAEELPDSEIIKRRL